MTLSITHAKVSGIPDNAQSRANGEVLPSDWNAPHTLTGTVSNSQIENPNITISGHLVALGGSVTLAAADAALGNVTNDAQTKAAVVPNTAPAAGQVLAGNSGGTAYAPVSVSGDATLDSTGALTVSKVNGVSPGPFYNGTDAANLTGTLSAAKGGFGSNVSTQTGVPVFSSGVPTFASASITNTKVVVPSTASAAEQAKADYVAGSTNAEVAIAAALAAAGGSNSRVIIAPGTYTFSSTLNIPSANNCIIDARGTVFNGITGTADTVHIPSMTACDYRFGKIAHQGTGSGIHVVELANGSWLTWEELSGSSHQGKGLYVDASTTGSSTSYIMGGWTHGFDKGVHFYSKTIIDTHVLWLNFGYDCNHVIYDETDIGASVPNNAMRWYVNVDAQWAGASAAIWSNGAGHVIHGTIGSCNGGVWGAHVQLETAHGFSADGFTLNLTPLSLAHEVGNIINNSGNTNHILNVGMPIGMATGGYGNNLVKWSGSYPGQLDNTGIQLSAAGTSGRVLYFSSLGIIGEKAATGSGDVALSIGAALTNPVISGASPASAGAIGYTAGVLNWYDGASTRFAVATDAVQTLSNKSIVGTATNNDAAAGIVGEIMSAGIGSLSAAPSSTVTITIASPGVITWTAHGLAGVSPVVFTTTGALPTGITSGTVYWTIPSSITANTFTVAASIANALAGTAINTSGTQSGTHTGKVGVPLTTNVPANGCAINLTAGDWDISGTGFFTGPTATTLNYLVSGGSLTSASYSGSSGSGASAQTYPGSTPFATLSVLPQQFGPQRISLASTTTIYGVIQGGFGASTLLGFAFLRARRVR